MGFVVKFPYLKFNNSNEKCVGWTSPGGREFGAIGQIDGTAFVEIVKNGKVEYLGRLPTQTEPSVWRDMKVVDGYCYIGSEAADHGIQVFDMRKVCFVEALHVYLAKIDV